MKELLLVFGLLALVSFKPIHQNSEKGFMESYTQSVACKYGQCNAKAKSTGNRCKHCVSNSGDLNCWQHK